jgi:cytoskeletal protein RodZ
MTFKSAHTAKVGKAFKNARILHSMTEEEVATQISINIKYIKGIESGDYGIFPARIFAVQYFKKYAKFLNLEISFFDIYNAEVVAKAEKEVESDLSNKFFLKKNIIYISIIFLVFLISLIFIFQGDNNFG